MARKDARIRTGLTRPASEPGAPSDPRIHVDLAHLRGLEGRSRQLSFLPRQPARSVLNGRHASRLRGRGLNFEELRDYLPGDDVRSIDWKVTARTGKPHVRVFTEERDRPALLVIDQRMSMFFGTVLNMKSTTAAEAGALAAYRILDQGDRVGGIVFGDTQIAEIRPQRSRVAVNQLLACIVEANSALRADAPDVEPIGLNKVLASVARIATRDHLVILISDFAGIDAQTRVLVSGMARHNDVVLLLVSDPIADEFPEDMKLVVSDGQLQAEIDGTDGTVRQAVSDASSGRLNEILDWQRTTGVPVLPLSAALDTLDQIRNLLGAGPGR